MATEHFVLELEPEGLSFFVRGGPMHRERVLEKVESAGDTGARIFPDLDERVLIQKQRTLTDVACEIPAITRDN